MGHSIVYCDKCGQLLREEDFRVGKASTADNRNYCSACRPTGSSPALPVQPGRKVSSTRIPKQPPFEHVSSTRIPKQPTHESRRIPVQPAAPPAPPPPSEPSSARLIYFGGAGATLVVVVLVAVFTGGKAETRRPEEAAPTQTVVTAPKAVAEGLPPEDRRREEAARAACMKGYEIATTRPKDLAGQWRAFEAAVAASQGTNYLGDATTQLEKVRRRFEEERAALEVKSQEFTIKDQYKPALDLWESETRRYDVAPWTGPLAQRIADLKTEVDRRIVVLRDTAVDARRKGDEAEVKRVRARVTGWGLPGYPEQIDQALAGVVAEKPETPPETGAAPKAVDAYRARWKALAATAAGRDGADWVKSMEKLASETKDEAKKEAADDLENLRLAASLVQEGGALVPKLAKGQRIALVYWEPGGSLARVEEAILKIDTTRVEIKLGEGSIIVPFGEIASSTLADLFKARPSKKESDSRAAVVACLLDGDAEGAQRFRGEPFPMINEKYAEAAKEILARRATDENEQAARKLFYEAERDYFEYGLTAGAAAGYRALLAQHGATAFVRRNRAAIAARAEGGLKDFLYLSGDLAVAPTFKLGKFAKVESAWVSQHDLDPAKARENFVELEFSATPDAEYRCWIQAGGCCQEVLTFSYQGTELTGPDPANPKEKVAIEPGGVASVVVKSTNSSLKKLHSQHNGPKNPERFDWVHVGTFKFPTAGTKKIRILSNQKGFAVASGAVLGTRAGPPRELDFKELERWRAETPGASVKQGGIMTGSILREVWKDISGVTINDLVSQAAFKEDKPNERGLISIFEGPTDWADNYGTRIRGYVHPPVSGAYVFWIASDDNGELWLSSDEDPGHKEKIASVPDFTSPRQYDKHASQQSKPMELKAGRRYYIEALQKEGGGGDNISVGWQLPSGVQERPIPGNRLSPFVSLKK